MDDYKPLSEKELEQGYFFLTHQDIFKRIIGWASMAGVAIIYIVLLFQAISFFQGSSWQQMAVEVNKNYDWATYHQQRSPQLPSTSPVQFLSIGQGRYNLLAIIENTNTDWGMTEFEYTFVVNGEALETQKSFLNPGEKRLITNLGQTISGSLNNVSVSIDNINWYYVENDMPEVVWDIKDVEFHPASRQLVDGETISTNPNVTWTAQNLSVYNFWEVGWQVVLMSGGRVVGVNEINTTDFESLESRDLEAVWWNSLQRVSSIEIYPVLNKLDSKSFKTLYLTPEGNDLINL